MPKAGQVVSAKENNAAEAAAVRIAELLGKRLLADERHEFVARTKVTTAALVIAALAKRIEDDGDTPMIDARGKVKRFVSAGEGC